MVKQVNFILMLMMAVTTALGHELNFGLFDLYEKDNSIYLEIRLDKDYTMKAIGLPDDLQSIESLSCELSAYIDENLSLSINSHQAILEFINFSSNEEVVVIQAKIDMPHQEISEIKVHNTVLLSTVENQNNIIKASFHQKKRSFRLNAKRISTIIKY